MSGAAPGLGGRGAGDPGSSYSSSSRPVSAPSYTSPDRAARLSPTTVGSVFPALENLQRISHGHASASSATAGGSGGGVSSSSAPSGRDDSAAPSRVTRSPSAAASSSYSAHQHPTAHHHHHHQTRSSTSTPRGGGGGGGGGSGVLLAMSGGPAVISQPTLPTYRQASVEGPSGGVLSSHGGSFPPATAAPLHHRHSTSDIPPYSLESALPDILHSHILPQIPPPRQNQHRQQRDRTRASRNSGGNNNNSSSNNNSSNNNNNNNRSGDSNNNSNSNNNESRDQQRRNNRHRSTHGGDRSHRHHRHRRRLRSQPSSSSASQGEGGMCKEPCVKCVVTVTSFRWVLVVLSVLGVCCVVTGIVLAALHAAGNSFLFLAIMFIGLGVLLVIVVGVGWKCTPRGHEPLHALFGIGNFRTGQTRERRHRRHRNRDSNWYGGVMYPEFQYRRPPPSYAASMQDYQNQAAAGDGPPASATGQAPSGDQSWPNSPPPSYRSRASTIHSAIQSAFPNSHDGDHPSSRPPTYRSRAPSRRPSLPREEIHPSDGGGGVTTTAAPADVSFSGPSSSTIGSSNGATSITISSSLPSSHQVPTSSSLAAALSPLSATATPQSAGDSSTTAAVSSASMTMQVYTVPLVSSSSGSGGGGGVNTNFNGSSNDSHSLPSGGISVMVTPPSNSPPPHQPSSSASVNPSSGVEGGRLPSLHQRMESGDRVRLEQALQSLEQHISHGAEGITNRGASFEETDFNTHL